MLASLLSSPLLPTTYFSTSQTASNPTILSGPGALVIGICTLSFQGIQLACQYPGISLLLTGSAVGVFLRHRYTSSYSYQHYQLQKNIDHTQEELCSLIDDVNAGEMPDLEALKRIKISLKSYLTSLDNLLKEHKKAENEIKKLKDKVTTQQKEMVKLKQEIDTLKSEKKKDKATIEALRAQVADLQERLETRNARNNVLEAQNQTKAGELAISENTACTLWQQNQTLTSQHSELAAKLQIKTQEVGQFQQAALKLREAFNQHSFLSYTKIKTRKNLLAQFTVLPDQSINIATFTHIFNNAIANLLS